MVSISGKDVTAREAVAKGRIIFSNSETAKLIQSNTLKKGDVLAVARIAGIMAAKRTSDLIPLCHPLSLSSVAVDLEVDPAGAVDITATVRCEGKTGVEMEALTAATVSALTIYDMVKAVDRHMRIEQVRVVHKAGGKSGDWSA